MARIGAGQLYPFLGLSGKCDPAWKSRIFNNLGRNRRSTTMPLSQLGESSADSGPGGSGHPCGETRGCVSHSPRSGHFRKSWRANFGPNRSPLASGEIFMTNGNGAQEAAPPQLNVLAQYTKDLS